MEHRRGLPNRPVGANYGRGYKGRGKGQAAGPSQKGERPYQQRPLEAKLKGPARRGKPNHPRFAHFGISRIPILEEGDAKRFRPLHGRTHDVSQQCLLDAVYNADARELRLEACNAMSHYFSKIEKAPLGKNYAYYAMHCELETSISSTYTNFLERARHIPTEMEMKWQGFYSLEEAEVWAESLALRPVWIERDTKPASGTYLEAQHQRIRQLEKEIADLELKLDALTTGNKPGEPAPEGEEDSDEFLNWIRGTEESQPSDEPRVRRTTPKVNGDEFDKSPSDVAAAK